jgi:hypothetical protein
VSLDQVADNGVVGNECSPLPKQRLHLKPCLSTGLVQPVV